MDKSPKDKSQYKQKPETNKLTLFSIQNQWKKSVILTVQLAWPQCHRTWSYHFSLHKNELCFSVNIACVLQNILNMLCILQNILVISGMALHLYSICNVGYKYKIPKPMGG